MLLLVVQVLQLEMQPVDLLASLGGGVFGVAHPKASVPILAAELGQESKQDLLLLGDGQREVVDASGVGPQGIRIEQGQQLMALSEGLGAGAEHGLQRLVGDDVTDSHYRFSFFPSFSFERTNISGEQRGERRYRTLNGLERVELPRSGGS